MRSDGVAEGLPRGKKNSGWRRFAVRVDHDVVGENSREKTAVTKLGLDEKKRNDRCNQQQLN
jgi:hypothetical protein